MFRSDACADFKIQRRMNACVGRFTLSRLQDHSIWTYMYIDVVLMTCYFSLTSSRNDCFNRGTCDRCTRVCTCDTVRTCYLHVCWIKTQDKANVINNDWIASYAHINVHVIMRPTPLHLFIRLCDALSELLWS